MTHTTTNVFWIILIILAVFVFVNNSGTGVVVEEKLVFQKGDEACVLLDGIETCKPIADYVNYVAGDNPSGQNFYRHTPVEVNDEAKTITIMDGMVPTPHEFKLSFDFFMGHTKFEHQWSTDDPMIKSFFEGDSP